MTAPAIPPAGWVRYPHRTYKMAMGGASISGTVPSATVRISAPNAGAGAKSTRTNAVLDTGAVTTMVPMWALQDLDVGLDEGSKTKVAGATGWAEAYHTSVRLELSYDDEWLDMGPVGVLSPDTEWSRHRKYNLPVLLGRAGFFDRFHMLFDQAGEAAWLRKID